MDSGRGISSWLRTTASSPRERLKLADCDSSMFFLPLFFVPLSVSSSDSIGLSDFLSFGLFNDSSVSCFFSITSFPFSGLSVTVFSFCAGSLSSSNLGSWTSRCRFKDFKPGTQQRGAILVPVVSGSQISCDGAV
jgi:hypothetical protein